MGLFRAALKIATKVATKVVRTVAPLARSASLPLLLGGSAIAGGVLVTASALVSVTPAGAINLFVYFGITLPERMSQSLLALSRFLRQVAVPL